MDAEKFYQRQFTEGDRVYLYPFDHKQTEVISLLVTFVGQVWVQFEPAYGVDIREDLPFLEGGLSVISTTTPKAEIEDGLIYPTREEGDRCRSLYFYYQDLKQSLPYNLPRTTTLQDLNLVAQILGVEVGCYYFG
jgi:hypothetical protein